MQRREHILNSVPCEPPSWRYIPPDSAVVCSIPDFTLLRIDSTDDGVEEVTSSLHYGDGLSDTDDSADDGLAGVKFARIMGAYVERIEGLAALEVVTRGRLFLTRVELTKDIEE